MQYGSIALVGEYSQWMIGIAGAIITARIIHIISSMGMSQDENISIHTILTKISKHIKALVIAICVEAIIELIQNYYFHV